MKLMLYYGGASFCESITLILEDYQLEMNGSTLSIGWTDIEQKAILLTWI